MANDTTEIDLTHDNDDTKPVVGSFETRTGRREPFKPKYWPDYCRKFFRNPRLTGKRNGNMRANCLLCGKSLSSSVSTGNFMSHLKRKHQERWNQFASRTGRATANGSKAVDAKKGRTVEDDVIDGEVMDLLVHCNIPLNVLDNKYFVDFVQVTHQSEVVSFCHFHPVRLAEVHPGVLASEHGEDEGHHHTPRAQKERSRTHTLEDLQRRNTQRSHRSGSGL